MWDADKSSDVDMEAEQAKVPNNGSEQAKNQSEPNQTGEQAKAPDNGSEHRKDLGGAPDASKRRGSTTYR